MPDDAQADATESLFDGDLTLRPPPAGDMEAAWAEGVNEIRTLFVLGDHLRDRLAAIIANAAAMLEVVDHHEMEHLSFMLGRLATKVPEAENVLRRAIRVVVAASDARAILAEAEPPDPDPEPDHG